MANTDLSDFEVEYATTTDSGLTVQIEKLGGGTRGKSYTDEYWRYIVTDANGTELGRGQDLRIGHPATHEQAAAEAAAFFESD
jgi:hypothetical protein